MATNGALITINRANSRILTGVINDTADPPVPLDCAGYDLAFQVKPVRGGVAVIGPFSTDDGGTPKPEWIDITAGTFKITLDASDTDIDPATYEAEIKIDDGTDAGKYTVLEFQLQILGSLYA